MVKGISIYNGRIGQGDFIMHRVELLNWHCAEFTIYHGNIPDSCHFCSSRDTTAFLIAFAERVESGLEVCSC